MTTNKIEVLTKSNDPTEIATMRRDEAAARLAAVDLPIKLPHTRGLADSRRDAAVPFADLRRQVDA
ncbi:hypothetical protein LWV33_23270 [Brucella intermedia]